MIKAVKVIFMARETYSSDRALNYLCKNRDKVEVAGAVIRSTDMRLRKICDENSIPLLTEEEVKEYYGGGREIDYILSFYWKKIKGDMLSLPRSGSINFHPGPLPEARGSGYHAAILEDWKYWGVTAHYMDEEFDTGAIIECRYFSIDGKILNKDLVRMAHEELAMLFEDVMGKIFSGEELEKKKQGHGRYFSLKELEESKLIRNDEDNSDIDRKIRAFWNPPHRLR